MSNELIDKMARALCSAGSEEVGLCFRDDDPHEYECVKSCVACRNVARSIATALIEHAGGDGVTEGDKRAATELMVGPKVAGGDGQTYVLRTPSYSEASKAFARHRATAFAAGRAARERAIVEWLRGQDNGRAEGAGYRHAADAIEAGEV